MKVVKHIPNALSAFRFVASFLLFWAVPRRELFVPLFLFLGLSDTLDGRIARKYHAQSEFGAKLDTVADVTFFSISFICALFLRRPEIESVSKCVVTLCAAFALKLTAVAITRVKFGEWNSMHTYANKAVGVAVFFSLPVAFWIGQVGYGMVLLIAGMLALAAVEEICILLTSGSYDVNRKGILINTRHRRSGLAMKSE